jgi:hypothetical protein
MRNLYRFLKRFIIFASFFVNAFLVFWVYDLVTTNTTIRDAANTLKVSVVTLESKVKDLTNTITEKETIIDTKKAEVVTLQNTLKSAICKVPLSEDVFNSMKTGEDVGPVLKKYITDANSATTITITEASASEPFYGNKLDFTYTIHFTEKDNKKDDFLSPFNIIYGATTGQKHDKDIHSIMDVSQNCFLYLSDYEIVIVND